MGMSVFLTGLVFFLIAVAFHTIVGIFGGVNGDELHPALLFTWAISFYGGIFATVIGLLMIIWGV